MRLSISHETRYRYGRRVDTSHHQGHLSPLTGAQQTVLSHQLLIDPAPRATDASEHLDVWGNRISRWYLAQAHDCLRVSAYTQVETHTLPQGVSPITCGQAAMRQLQPMHPSESALRWTYPSRLVPQHRELANHARADLHPERELIEAAVAFMRRMRAELTYDPRSTQVDTPALTALRERRGVCQDFAHIMLGGLRQMGQAALYVSGYLLTQPPPGQARLIGADASHAWVALQVPGLDDHPSRGWLHLDPTNARHGWGSPGEDYVVLAMGRDYSDVSPLRGVLRGGSATAPEVRVTVEPMAPASPSTPPQA